MQVRCVPCGTDHNLTPTSMRYALLAFQNGDAQSVTGEGVVGDCLIVARQNGFLFEEVIDDAPTVEAA